MKKIVYEYLNMKDEEVIIVADEDGDAFYKINLDKFVVSDIPDIFSSLFYEKTLKDAKSEIYVSEDYADKLIGYFMDMDLEDAADFKKIDIYNLDEEFLFTNKYDD